MTEVAPRREARTGLPVTTVAFEGFEIARREPRTLVVWTVLMMVLTLGGGGLSLLMVGSVTPAAGARANPALMGALFSRLLPFYAIVTVVSLAIYGVIYAAVNRAVLRPGTRGWGHLRLGADELRQVGVLLLIWLLLLVAYVVLLLAVVLATVAAWNASKPLGVLVGFVAGAAAICAVVYLLVRLSLVSPLAFDQRRIAFGAAWRMTRGRFWPLLGAYALASVVALVIVMIASTLGLSIGMATAGGPLAMAAGDPGQASAALMRMQFLNLLFTSLSYGVVFALLLGAPARAYAEIMRPSRAAEVFGPAA